MEKDGSVNTYVVGAWVGDTLVFPNGFISRLSKQLMTSNEPSDHRHIHAKMNSDGEWKLLFCPKILKQQFLL